MHNKIETPLSDEIIHALVDNEFPAQERAELLQHIQRDEVTRDKACQFRNIKDMVKTAYNDVPQPVTNTTNAPPAKTTAWWSVAASIMLGTVALILAFFNHQPAQNMQRMVLLDPDGSGQKIAQSNTQEMRIVFHVNHAIGLDADELLQDIEGLIQEYHRQNKKIRVEVVANAGGLDMLRSKLSTQKAHIATLSRAYPELTFVACLNTIERLRVEQGIVVTLVPEAKTATSGVAHVVKRQQQGWIYIQV